MRVLVHLDERSHTGRMLRRIIETAHPEEDVEYHETVSSLVDALTPPGRSWGVAVLQIPDRKALDELVSIREWIKDLRIILILPDHWPETISRGHLLRPRFVGFEGGDLKSVGVVLKKMVRAFDKVL